MGLDVLVNGSQSGDSWFFKCRHWFNTLIPTGLLQSVGSQHSAVKMRRYRNIWSSSGAVRARDPKNLIVRRKSTCWILIHAIVRCVWLCVAYDFIYAMDVIDWQLTSLTQSHLKRHFQFQCASFWRRYNFGRSIASLTVSLRVLLVRPFVYLFVCLLCLYVRTYELSTQKLKGIWKAEISTNIFHKRRA